MEKKILETLEAEPYSEGMGTYTITSGRMKEIAEELEDKFKAQERMIKLLKLSNKMLKEKSSHFACKECNSNNVHYTCSDCGFLAELINNEGMEISDEEIEDKYEFYCKYHLDVLPFKQGWNTIHLSWFSNQRQINKFIEKGLLRKINNR